MTPFVINPPKQAILDRVAIHAGEQASLSLTKWFGRNVKIHTEGFATATLAEVSEVIDGGDSAVVAVHTRIEGALGGHVLLAFPERVAAQLVSLLVGEPVADASCFDELSRSAITETGNIVSSVFLNGLATTLGVRAQPSAATFQHDLGAALIDSLVAEQLQHSANVLYVQATFEIDGVSLDWWLYVMPSPECMQVMVALLH